jgi:transposase
VRGNDTAAEVLKTTSCSVTRMGVREGSALSQTPFVSDTPPLTTGGTTNPANLSSVPAARMGFLTTAVAASRGVLNLVMPQCSTRVLGPRMGHLPQLSGLLVGRERRDEPVPGFLRTSFVGKDGAMSIRYDENTKARAVRLVREHRDDYDSEWAAMKAISGRLGMNPETQRKWMRQAEVEPQDTRRRPNGPVLQAARHLISATGDPPTGRGTLYSQESTLTPGSQKCSPAGGSVISLSRYGAKPPSTPR